MNELEALARFRADVPAPDPQALARARAGMFGDRPERPRRSPIRMAARLAPVGALAAVAAVAALLHWVPMTESPAAPKTDPKAVDVLLQAAFAASEPGGLPARGDQFVFFRTEWAQPPQGSLTGITIDQRVWISVDNRHIGRFWMETDPAHVAGPTDRTVPPHGQACTETQLCPGRPACRPTRRDCGPRSTRRRRRPDRTSRPSPRPVACWPPSTCRRPSSPRCCRRSRPSPG